jgi:hypothetical protein
MEDMARAFQSRALIAPDYPRFGNSDAPSPERFSYAFDTITDIVDGLTQAIHLDRH